ncbi:Sulfotransferase domain protein [Pseudoalteromonas sp. P1-26]|uniref:sulfotransferase family protein n=1 Tax=Pseudoalteromonas sp. P1-26 TaxID=1723759 RepID=UPI0006D67078|nr:sulfotransferase [Pseudoalteromonas sp. P1-26]KPZ67175.1 Sulfotransferase domain protein [Pseudoalteromonas sp. P1-26]
MNDPIFIIGCDRSGTTFLGDILGGAKAAFTTPESHFFHDLFRLHQLDRLHNFPSFDAFLNTNGRLATWDLNKEDLIEGYKSTYQTNRDLKEFILCILSLYIKKHNIQGELNELTWIDHTPDNLFMSHYWKLIFPDCKFVHIVRDGRAVLTSLSQLPWGPSTPHFCSVFWSQKVLQGIYLEKLYRSSTVTVRYEDILLNQSDEISSLCVKVGLNYTSDMLLGGSLKLPSFTKSQHAYVGKGITLTSLNKWKDKLNKKQINEFENSSFARECLEYFNYELITETKTLRVVDLVPSMLIELVGYVKSRLYFRKLNRSNNE